MWLHGACVFVAAATIVRHENTKSNVNKFHRRWNKNPNKYAYAKRVELFILFSNDLAFHESIVLLYIYNCHVANALPMNQTKNTARLSASTVEKNNFDIVYFHECRFSNYTQTITSKSTIISWLLKNELNKNQTFEFKWDWIITKLTIC